jgi:MoxR-like ATPase
MPNCQEMDPFTFFANFNRAIRTDNRQAIIRELKALWNLASEVPSDFEGIPLVDLRAAWFFPFARDRNRDDVSKLWRLAREAFTKNASEFDRRLLADCLPIKSVSLGKLTIGMFWLNPSAYISVDSKNLHYLADRRITLANKTAEAYFELLGKASNSIGTDFVRISREAYETSAATKDKGAAQEDRSEGEFRYWAISAGHGGEQWARFLDEGLIAIDWDLGTDLRQLPTREEIGAKMAEVLPGQSSRRNNALACWQFVRDMRIGDIVFAKEGADRLLRCGWVTSDYSYDPSRNEYQHIRQVSWESSGDPWILPANVRLPDETLTDVTEQADLLEFLRRRLARDSKHLGYWVGRYVLEMRERYGDHVRRAAIENMVRLTGWVFNHVGQWEHTMRNASSELLNRAPNPTVVKTIVATGVKDSDGQIYVLERATREAQPGTDPSKKRIKEIVREVWPQLSRPVPELADAGGAARYWWLNVNPGVWDIERLSIGGTHTYTSHNEKGNKRRKYQYFSEVKPGDVMVGYITSPRLEVAALCEVTMGLFGEGDEERIEFKKIEQLRNPVGYEELKANPVLAQSEPLVNNQGSLFALTEEEFEVVRDLIDEKNRAPSKLGPLPYSKDQALAELFVTEQELDEIMARLHRKKNLVLQGPPGVGKTFVARRLAYMLIGAKDQSRLEMVQFHQSYAYEDFVQGYRPSDQTGFALRTGLFYDFCKRARVELHNPYVFIIDEINRGNLSKIFGELMMLLEHDKRGPEFAIPLTYSRTGDDRFYVPENLYIIGTMNTADRSLSLVDYALRRRFAFFYLRPKFDSDLFAQALEEAGASGSLIKKIQERLGALNKQISEDTRNLGPGYCIGHSYFCTDGSRRNLDESWYRRVIESEINPLLEEYWVDDEKRVRELVARLLD